MSLLCFLYRLIRFLNSFCMTLFSFLSNPITQSIHNPIIIAYPSYLDNLLPRADLGFTATFTGMDETRLRFAGYNTPRHRSHWWKRYVRTHLPYREVYRFPPIDINSCHLNMPHIPISSILSTPLFPLQSQQMVTGPALKQIHLHSSSLLVRTRTYNVN